MHRIEFVARSQTMQSKPDPSKTKVIFRLRGLQSKKFIAFECSQKGGGAFSRKTGRCRWSRSWCHVTSRRQNVFKKSRNRNFFSRTFVLPNFSRSCKKFSAIFEMKGNFQKVNLSIEMCVRVCACTCWNERDSVCLRVYEFMSAYVCGCMRERESERCQGECEK